MQTNILDNPIPKVKTVDTNHKVYCTEDYAQTLYDMMVSYHGNFVQPQLDATASGIVTAVNDSVVALDVKNFKSYVYLPLKGRDHELLVDVKVGDVVEFLITAIEDEPYQVYGSVSAFETVHTNEVIDSLHYNQDAFKVVVDSMNSAGYNVVAVFDSVKVGMFLPHMQAGANRINVPESLIGQEIEVMLTEYSDEHRCYMVSRKKYLETLIPQEIKKLELYEEYAGKVTGTTDYGVFVEFNGCLTGMIHKANVNPDWTDRLHEIKPGMEIKFFVKEIIKDKLILSQIVRASIWDTIKMGQKIDGTVKDEKQFGLLVQLDEETLGLVHNTEVEKSKKNYKKGDAISVKVLSANRNSRKIFLAIA